MMTDVMQILRDVRGDGVEETEAGVWLGGFCEVCESGGVNDVKVSIIAMPKGDLLIATLASLTKWEHNNLANNRWSLGDEADTCPLCIHISSSSSCESCPLEWVGQQCTEPDDYDGEFTSAWDIAVRCDSRPLIKALKDALDVVIEKDKKHK